MGCSGGIIICSRGFPGLFRAVPGCSGGVPGVFRGVPGVFRGVPWCSGVFRAGCSGCVPGFTDTHERVLSRLAGLAWQSRLHGKVSARLAEIPASRCRDPS